MWYSRETMIEMFNSDIAMSEAIFKATYLEDEVKIGDNNKVTPANILPLIGTEWAKKVPQGENVQETLIGAIAKVMWRVYHKQAALVIELLKKENQDKLLRVFGQEGVLQEWAKKQGITLTYGQLEVFPEEIIQESGEKVTPAETMGLKLKELREGNDHEKKGIISEKLRDYLNEWYPKNKQQIHAHMMSMNTRALIGVLFTPGLFDEEVEQISKGSSELYKQKGEGEVVSESNIRKNEEEKMDRGKEMENVEQNGKQKGWKSPGGGTGEKNQSPGKNGSPGQRGQEGKKRNRCVINRFRGTSDGRHSCYIPNS